MRDPVSNVVPFLWMMTLASESSPDDHTDSGRSSLCLLTEHVKRTFLSCHLCGQVYNKPRVGPASSQRM